MLSYRHSYHAGNFADVIKHIVVIEILEYLVRKEGAFAYIDTHAGAGLYNLRSAHATKLQEYSNGIAKLESAAWPELAGYFQILAKLNPSGELINYPGSPLIAMQFLRPQDRTWLYEMHPTDFEILQKNTAMDARVRIMREDGFKGLLAQVPPVSRRGLILVDPSYEIKTDYPRVTETVTQACKKFSTGIYAIWYPVVDRRRIEEMARTFIRSGIRNIQRFELGIAAESEDRGMPAAGMIVINPPWTLREKMSLLLPRLVAALGTDAGAYSKCDVLVGE